MQIGAPLTNSSVSDPHCEQLVMTMKRANVPVRDHNFLQAGGPIALGQPYLLQVTFRFIIHRD
jgi:hypothetical protein